MKSFVKYAKIILVAILCLSLSLLFVACGGECNHEYGSSIIIKEATCTTNGEKESTCTNCGEVKKETLYALGHTYVYELNNTEHWKKCSVCGEAQAAEEHLWQGNACFCGFGSDCQHTFGDWQITTEPTCTARKIQL